MRSSLSTPLSKMTIRRTRPWSPTTLRRRTSSSGPRTSKMTTSSSSPRAHKTSDSSRKENRNSGKPKSAVNMSRETSRMSSEPNHMQCKGSESKDSSSYFKSISTKCHDYKRQSPITISCKSNSDPEHQSKVNKYYVQNLSVSENRENNLIPVRKNLHNHFFSSTISCSKVHSMCKCDRTPGGPASTCSGTSAKSQVTERDLNFGETKNAEGGVLVNNVDSSSNGNVNVSKLIA